MPSCIGVYDVSVLYLAPSDPYSPPKVNSRLRFQAWMRRESVLRHTSATGDLVRRVHSGHWLRVGIGHAYVVVFTCSSPYLAWEHVFVQLHRCISDTDGMLDPIGHAVRGHWFKACDASDTTPEWALSIMFALGRPWVTRCEIEHRYIITHLYMMAWYTQSLIYSETELRNTRVRTSWRNRPAQIRKSVICRWSCILPIPLT